GLIGGLLAPVVHGATCWILSPLEFMLRPASWMQAVSDTRATLTVAPNFAYGLVARKVVDEDLRGLDLSALRAAINGAEPVDPGIAEAFSRRLAPMGFRASSYFPVYGLAECTLSVAFPPLGRGVKLDHVRREDLASGRAAPMEHGPGSMGVVPVRPRIAGRSYSPSDIERAAEQVEGVRAGRSVAFGVADADLGTESLVVLAEVRPRSPEELVALAESVRETVAEQVGLSPKDVCLLKPGSLARTSSGKLMRRDARERYLGGGLAGAEALRPKLPVRLVDAARGV